MPRRGLFVLKLHGKNVRRLYFQANRLHMPVSKLLNLIVCTGLEYLEAVNDLDESDAYTVVRPEEPWGERKVLTFPSYEFILYLCDVPPSTP